MQLALVACSGTNSSSTAPAANTTSSATAPAASIPVNGGVGMSASTYGVVESAGSITLTAQRTGGHQGALSVTYNTVDGTAVSGENFTAETGTLIWADGDSANKTFVIPISNAKPFIGTKSFAVQLTAATGTLLEPGTNATIDIVGTPPAGPTVTKSIRGWVSCSETIDESAQLEQALLSAANNAFTLIIDCPVRFHSGTASLHSIAVPDGVTLSFQGAGEFLMVNSGPPALTVAHPSEVTFLDWNLIYL